jgi:hypothetical protein
MSSTLLAKIGEGILIGVAAGITIGAIMYLETRWAMSEIDASSFDMPGFKSYGPDAKLSIRSHRPKAPGAANAFIGEVANDGTDSWDYVQLVVELFDKEGNFVGKCTDNLDGRIGPGQVRNFEVSCSNCRDSAVPAYDRYTIEIVDANFEQVSHASR